MILTHLYINLFTGFEKASFTVVRWLPPRGERVYGGGIVFLSWRLKITLDFAYIRINIFIKLQLNC